MPINKSDQSISSGDPNFCAALMTVGCPPHDPAVQLIAADNGFDYVSFRIQERSIYGVPTMQYSAAWVDAMARRAMEATNEPFARVMAFSAAKTRNTGPSREAWIVHLAAWLEITRDAAFALMVDVAAVCRTSPESDASYCCAFIENRFHLLDLAAQFKRDGNIDIFMNHDAGFSIISEKQPQRIRDYLLSKSK